MEEVILKTPIPYGKGTLDKLVFRRPQAGDLRGLKLIGLSEMNVDLVLAIAKRLSVEPVGAEHLDMLAPGDLLRVTSSVIGFFDMSEAPSPTTQGEPGP